MLFLKIVLVVVMVLLVFVVFDLLFGFVSFWLSIWGSGSQDLGVKRFSFTWVRGL